MKFKIVDGYKGSTDVVLAMERNEVQRHLPDHDRVRAVAAQRLLDDGTVRILFTTEREPVPELKVPTVFEFAKTDEQRKILEFHASSLETGPSDGSLRRTCRRTGSRPCAARSTRP